MIEGKKAQLSIDRPEELQKVAHALSSEARISVLRALGEKSRSVGELAELLDVPMSSAALAVKTLEEAGLILTETQPGVHGALKLCSRRIDQITIDIDVTQRKPESVLTVSMPIGGYSDAFGIEPTCGLADEHTFLGNMDVKRSFYLPDRFNAQLIWFRQGMLEYHFSTLEMEGMVFDWMEFSF